MYMKSLVSLAVLGAMSAVATAGDLVAFDKPNESYTVDGLSKYGAKINASDITITNTTYRSTPLSGSVSFPAKVLILLICWSSARREGRSSLYFDTSATAESAPLQFA